MSGQVQTAAASLWPLLPPVGISPPPYYPALHPLVVAALQLLLSLMALVGYSQAGDENRD